MSTGRPHSIARFTLIVLELAMVAAALLLATFVTLGFIESRFVGELPEPDDADVLTELLPDDVTLPTVPADVAPPTAPADVASPTVPADVAPPTASADVSPSAPATGRVSAEAPTLPAPRLKAPRPPKVGSLIGRIEAPSARLVARVLEGTDTRTLFRGAGHIRNTPLPGQSGNVGIAGHRDTVFRPLRLLKVGDPITVTTASRVLKYKVSKTWVVNPEDVQVLRPTARPALTLVTCYPFVFVGHAPQRYIVRADLISTNERRSKR